MQSTRTLGYSQTHENLIDPQPEQQELLTFEQSEMFETVNNAGICCALGLFGLMANIINMVIFVKQRLNTPINISLFSLSLSDFCGLATLVWMGICFNPKMKYGRILIHSEEVGYMTGAWPHTCFARITCWLTTFITAERCVCIAFPLKSKQLITGKRTACVMCFLYLWTIALLIPQYMVSTLEWRMDERKARIIIGHHFNYNLIHLEAVSFILNTANGICSFTALCVFTIILIVKLKQHLVWRRGTVTSNIKRDLSHTDREKKTMLMVLMISILLICCYLPGILASIVTSLDAEFGVHGKKQNIFVASWSVFLILEAVNSSSNIFFYYTMSTKYRQICTEMFTRCKGHTRG